MMKLSWAILWTVVTIVLSGFMMMCAVDAIDAANR